MADEGVIADEHRGTVVTKNLRIRATVLWDGFAIGTWAIKATKTKAVLDDYRSAPIGEPGWSQSAAARVSPERCVMYRFSAPAVAVMPRR